MTQRLPRPCSAELAVARAINLLVNSSLGNATHPDWLGTGNYPLTGADVPWTTNAGGTGCDCHGLACWAYTLPRHRPGYNHGAHATVSDDDNCDAAIEDSTHERDLWTLVELLPAPRNRPEPGDLLCWPTIRVGGKRVRYAHTLLVESVDRVTAWDWATPAWPLIDVIQVKGPNGRKPAAVRSTAAICAAARYWGGAVHEEYRTRVLRSVP